MLQNGPPSASPLLEQVVGKLVAAYDDSGGGALFPSFDGSGQATATRFDGCGSGMPSALRTTIH
jgi:hypothetical protein